MATDWFVSQGGERLGPLSEEQLRGLVIAKRLMPTDLIWRQGMPEWLPAGRIKGLFPQDSTPPPLPEAPGIVAVSRRGSVSSPHVHSHSPATGASALEVATPALPASKTGYPTEQKQFWNLDLSRLTGSGCLLMAVTILLTLGVGMVAVFLIQAFPLTPGVKPSRWMGYLALLPAVIVGSSVFAIGKSWLTRNGRPITRP